MTTVVHQTTTVVKVVPATPESLWDLRQKYRAGLIVLGDFFAVLDRFLDGAHPEAKPAKEKANEPK
jgi:hypothetical protein